MPSRKKHNKANKLRQTGKGVKIHPAPMKSLSPSAKSMSPSPIIRDLTNQSKFGLSPSPVIKDSRRKTQRTINRSPKFGNNIKPLSEEQIKINYYNNLIDEFLKLPNDRDAFGICNRIYDNNHSTYHRMSGITTSTRTSFDDIIENELYNYLSFNRLIFFIRCINYISFFPIFNSTDFNKFDVSQIVKNKLAEIAVIYTLLPRVNNAYKLFFNNLKPLITKYINEKDTLVEKEDFIKVLSEIRLRLFCSYDKAHGIPSYKVHSYGTTDMELNILKHKLLPYNGLSEYDFDFDELDEFISNDDDKPYW